MRITVLGAGRIGGHIARQLAHAGHEVTVTFSRDPERLEHLAQELGARVAEPAAAVSAADVVVLSVPWDAIPAALEAAGPLDGKTVIDTTNQFGSGAMPAPGQTAAAFNAARLPGAAYGKSFNTLTAAFQAETSRRDPPVVQWVCGVDQPTRDLVSGLVRDAGYEPVDLGDIDVCWVMEAPRRPGAVYGEEYRPADAAAVRAAVDGGQPIPPTPVYT